MWNIFMLLAYKNISKNLVWSNLKCKIWGEKIFYYAIEVELFKNSLKNWFLIYIDAK